MSANSRLGAYPNKYGNSVCMFRSRVETVSAEEFRIKGGGIYHFSLRSVNCTLILGLEGRTPEVSSDR